MPYTFFQQCYKVLDMHKIHPTILDRRRLSMKREWYETPIDFSNQVTQCAYIRTDVPFHANVLLQIIKKHPELADLFKEEEEEEKEEEKEEETDESEEDDDENENEENDKEIVENHQDLNVMSVGCGPGTDMIALVKYIFNEKNFGNKKLRLFLTDDEPTWEKITDQFEMLIRKFQKGKARQLDFSKEFQVWKFLDGEIPRLQITNLFIFNLFFSNLAPQKDAKKEKVATANLWTIVSEAMMGAIFLFIDIDWEDAKSLRLKCLERAGFEIGIAKKIGQKTKGFEMPAEERKHDLREYFSLKCQPKFRHVIKMDYVIYQKL